MKSKNAFFALFILMFAMSAVAKAGEEEKTEFRNIKNYHAVEVSDGIDLFISMGSEEGVKVVADSDIIGDVKTEVKKGTLYITCDQKGLFNIFNWSWGSKSRQVYVTVKELKRIVASAGSDVKSGNLLEGDRVEVEASSGSDVDLEMVCRYISLKASSGSDVRLRGSAEVFSSDVSSGSDVNARQLEAVLCEVSASSGSDITVHALEKIIAKASSGGDVVYYGNPLQKDIGETSGGDVTGR